MKFKAFLIHNIYLCQICESNSHYGYECSQRVTLVYEPRLCYNQNIGDNAYTHDLPGVTPLIDHPCCYKCGDSLNDFFCHQCTYEFCGNDAHDGYNCPSQSSVENLFPSPSESEDLSDSKCDVPACDDFTTFSNLLFDADNDFSFSDNESFSDEYISKEIYSNPLFDEEIISMKIDSHHFNVESDLIESLLNHDSSIISSSLKIDSLLDEFAGELILHKSIPQRIEESDCDLEEEIRLIEKFLYDNSSSRPPKELIFENSNAAIESFSPSHILVEDSDSFMEEIDLSFTSDDPMLSGIEEDDYDSERDMLIFEEFLSNDSLSLLENESFHFDIPSFPCPPAKPPNDDSGIFTVKMVCDISEHDVPMPKLLPTQPTLISNQ
uniref:Pre-mRNA splicing Prp18-interacting factor n=1 Tax=Tanacetum cinerariifolium TaxID=118510 RepID=A0A699HYY0_TANCI|nr:hypothetical protein [Tanacetum cinerariifolium]